MPLDVPTRDEIVRRMTFRIAGQQAQLTDFTTISTTRILATEMIAEELMRLHAALVRANRDWYLDTDSVPALDRRLADFEQTRPGAMPAYGYVMVAVSADSDVPAGTIVRTDPKDGSAPKRYRVDPNVSPDISQGDSPTSTAWHIGGGTARQLPITATDAGPNGNTGVATITVAETTIPHLITGGGGVSNLAPIENGRTLATNAEFLQAFRDSLATLNRGTRPAIQAALRGFVAPGTTTPRVASSAVVEWDGNAMLRDGGRTVGMIIYIDGGIPWQDSEKEVADVGLVTAVRAFLRGNDTEVTSGQCPAGVPYAVRSALSLAIPLNVQVFVDQSLSTPIATALVTNAILSHFAALPCSGRTVLGELQGQFSLNHLNRDILNIPGVLRTVFSLPTTTDRQIPVGYKATAGRLNITITVVT